MLFSTHHFEGHASLSRREMETMVVTTGGPLLYPRPQMGFVFTVRDHKERRGWENWVSTSILKEDVEERSSGLLLRSSQA